MKHYTHAERNPTHVPLHSSEFRGIYIFQAVTISIPNSKESFLLIQTHGCCVTSVFATSAATLVGRRTGSPSRTLFLSWGTFTSDSVHQGCTTRKSGKGHVSPTEKAAGSRARFGRGDTLSIIFKSKN